MTRRASFAKTVTPYSEVDPAEWTELLDVVRERVRQSTVLEGAAAFVARELYERFKTMTALARVYTVVPYQELDRDP